ICIIRVQPRDGLQVVAGLLDVAEREVNHPQAIVTIRLRLLVFLLVVENLLEDRYRPLEVGLCLLGRLSLFLRLRLRVASSLEHAYPEFALPAPPGGAYFHPPLEFGDRLVVLDLLHVPAAAVIRPVPRCPVRCRFPWVGKTPPAPRPGTRRNEQGDDRHG